MGKKSDTFFPKQWTIISTLVRIVFCRRGGEGLQGSGGSLIWVEFYPKTLILCGNRQTFAGSTPSPPSQCLTANSFALRSLARGRKHRATVFGDQYFVVSNGFTFTCFHPQCSRAGGTAGNLTMGGILPKTPIKKAQDSRIRVGDRYFVISIDSIRTYAPAFTRSVFNFRSRRSTPNGMPSVHSGMICVTSYSVNISVASRSFWYFRAKYS